MKKEIKKAISTIAILTMTFQMGMSMIPALQTKVFATNMIIPAETENVQAITDKAGTTDLSESADTPTGEISKNYEIKNEETWDVSVNGDGSVIAKWTKKDKTLTISGTGKMKDWDNHSIDSIGDWHYTQYMYVIENVVINDGITYIGEYAFAYSENLKTVKMSDTVTGMGARAFEGCIRLENINISNRITQMLTGTFLECSSLKNITIPESVTSIWYDAFSECSSLENISIPASVAVINNNVFDGCSRLESIDVDMNNQNYTSENGILFSKDKTEIIRYPSAKKEDSYTIPNSVMTISDGAFEGCNNLIEIGVSDSITKIEDDAFENCSNLLKIQLPDSLTSIGNATFRSCSSLETIQIPDNVTNIGSYVFEKCTNLETVNIPKGVQAIPLGMFKECIRLKNIVIPDNITNINAGAFAECSSLESISIPNSVTTIGTNAFYECSSLKSIEIPESVTNINSIPTSIVIYAKADSEGHRYAEENKQAYILEGEATNIETNYEIKEQETWDISKSADESIMATWTLNDRTLTITGTGEMKNWDTDEEVDWHNTQYRNLIDRVVINEGITSIGEKAFYACNSLNNIEIANTVISIENSAFEKCIRLININIPLGVTTIQERTFFGCSSLENVNLSNNLKKIEWDVFDGCTSLEMIELPNNLIEIGTEAFNACKSLKNIEIPSTVKIIGYGVFTECTSLENIEVDNNNLNYTSENGILFNKEKTKIIVYPAGKNDIEYTIPNTVTCIGESAFKDVSSLETVRLPDSVITIENFAFFNCNQLKYLKIPSSVKEIEKNIFSDRSTIIYAKRNTVGHQFAEENYLGYILAYEKGDIDGNGVVNITDFLMLKRHLVAESKTEWILTGDGLSAGDMNEDAIIDITDMLILKKVLVDEM